MNRINPLNQLVVLILLALVHETLNHVAGLLIDIVAFLLAVKASCNSYFVL